ncbi:c-type cytochrome [Aureivirga sp. CE67]|uniref:c-type cytochrome n=1 Tax=Aureivirga sp. CE67 TaxID=1788983 RepID=UPI0018CA55C4|nr:c-type cytochrome [Aureivirga sp. CE67]
MIKQHFKINLLFFIFILGFFSSCNKDEIEYLVTEDTEEFKEKLSDYNIYDGALKNLIPTEDYHLYEIASPLFTNYAKKQRLIKLPPNSKMTKIDDLNPSFPDGTIIVKTFYYHIDDRNPSLGNKIIETRLLIKSKGLWNVGTYIWNDSQTEAVFSLDGQSKNVAWIDKNGNEKSVIYEIPKKQDCIVCHQNNAEISPIGPKLRNMNMDVSRNGEIINQLAYFQSIGMLDDFDHNLIGSLGNYFDESIPLDERGRAYFEMNCAHCHNPQGFSEAAKKGLDFRRETSLENTGILNKKQQIDRVIKDVYMPWIGTTTLDEEGYAVVHDYLNSL